MALADPHFRSEHEERHIVFPGDGNAARADIFFEDAHAHDIFNDPLEERHGIVLDDIALVVDEEHAQVVHVEVLLALLVQAVHIAHDELVRLLVFLNLLAAQFVDFRHRLVGQVHGAAALPRLRHPGMDIGIDNAVFHELVVVCGQFFLIPLLTNHFNLSLFHLNFPLEFCIRIG